MFKTLYTQHTQFGPVSYNSWGLTFMLAFIFAAMVAHHRAARVGIDPDKLVGVYLIAVFGGLGGSRLLHLLMSDDKSAFYANPMIFFDLTKGGFAVYGGFIGAGLGAAAYAKLRDIPILKMTDALSPTVMLGEAIGRVGCFLAGCCHGRVTEVPANAMALLPASWGPQLWLVPGPPFLIEMMVDGVGENHVPVLATQLYESFASVAIFLFTSWMWAKYRKFDGQITGMVTMLYSVWRPFNESLRGDTVRGTGYDVGGMVLTTSQVIAIPMFLLGLAIFLYNLRRGVAPEQPYEPRAMDDSGVPGGSAPRI